MEMRQLVTFVQIVRFGSFSKAAESLGYSQSAVTVQIRLLEEELNTKLFNRIGKRCTLTEKGTEFHAHAQHILHEASRARLSMQDEGELSGTLHIGTIESLCFSKLPPILREFHSRHPKAAIRITTASPERLFRMMEEDALDLIYILDELRFGANWNKELEEREEVVFVCAPDFLPDTARPASVTELLRYPFLLTEQNANYRRAFDQYLAMHSLKLRPFLEISNTDFILRMTKEGGGISLLPYFAVETDLKEGRLIQLPVTDFHTAMYRQIFYHRGKWKTREMDAFLQLAKSEVSASPS